MSDNIIVLPPAEAIASAEPVFGYRQPQDLSDDYNAFRFLFEQLAAEINTSIPARVESVNDNKTVNIVIMINQLMANMEASKHGIIYNVPYQQLQAGGFGIIAKPVAGDIGIALFSSRDIAHLKKVAQTEQPTQSVNPASLRRYDFSDAIYIGGVFNRNPTSYIEGDDTKINIVSQTITLTADNINLIGQVNITGSLYINGEQVTP